MMYCPDCQTDLESVPVGDPCPGCGGMRRSAVASPPPINVQMDMPGVSYKVTRSDERPWEEKWRSLLHHRKVLAEAYTTDAMKLGNVEVDERALSFFVACDHLRDWLEQGSPPLSGITNADIYEHLESSEPLKVCNAICVTHKHHTPFPGKTAARIRETTVSPAGARVTIEVEWATPAARTVDALDLANDCVASWRSFLQRFGIPEPG